MINKNSEPDSDKNFEEPIKNIAKKRKLLKKMADI